MSNVDPLIADIAHYVLDFDTESSLARDTARYCIMDALGCAMLALEFPECTKLLGPIVPGAITETGARVPGTEYKLDPVQAAFNLGAMIRWLDFNDTWLAAEWGHPSDNLGGILSVADFLSRVKLQRGESPLLMADVVQATIKAYEIQGVLALENSFNQYGFDHVLLVRVASAAVITQMMGGDLEQIANGLTNAWADGVGLRVYRHAPNTGPRKSWAAADATSRAVRLSLMVMQSEPGYASVLTTSNWGFQDVFLNGRSITLARPFSNYVIKNILFKILYPAEFHGQTAVEAAIKLHQSIIHPIEWIARVVIQTQESAMKIIDKCGPLKNPADRDHCIQYMVAVALILGELNAEHYQSTIAEDPRIDVLREKIELVENKRYSRDYSDPNKRSIANAVQIVFKDGSKSENVEIEFPLGHRRRRQEALPRLIDKLESNLSKRLSSDACNRLVKLTQDPMEFEAMPVDKFIDLFSTKQA